MPNIAHSELTTPHPNDDSRGDRKDDRERFVQLLRHALTARTFVRLVLAKPLASAGDLQRVGVRQVALRDGRSLSFVFSHPTRDVTKNFTPDEGLAAVQELLGVAFSHAHLSMTAEDAELRLNRKGHGTLAVRKSTSVTSRPSEQPTAATVSSTAPTEASPATAAIASAQPTAVAPVHDRVKRRWIDIGRPYLTDLGITDAQGRLVPAMARKWKQINKFVEVFDHAFAASALKGKADRPVRVVDFGSGKGYLTFALHDHLRHALGLEAEVTGVELRADLVELCNRAAERSALAGLHFVQGDVGTAAPPAIDVMIALHACDTATDLALHAGVRAGAEVILVSPCCHKELRPQMRSPAALQPMLQHGIHLGQQAEMVTDSLRALLLEAEGYATQVFEFVALEHTSKNKMILATRRARPVDRRAVLAQIDEIKAFYGIRDQRLEALLVETASAGSNAVDGVSLESPGQAHA